MENTLTQLGLSKNQEKIYYSLLKTGETTITELSRKAGFKRPTVYLIVEELYMLGLISQTKRGKNKIISPVHPRRLAQIVQLRAKVVEEKLPELVALYNSPKDKPKIQVFEGTEEIGRLYKELYTSLNNKEEALWLTRIDALEKIPESLNEFFKTVSKLKNPKIKELNYDNEAGRKWQKDTKKYRGKNHFMRFIPPEYEFGLSDNLIFGNKLISFSFGENIFVVVIESEQIVKTHRALFEFAWKHAKKA